MKKLTFLFLSFIIAGMITKAFGDNPANMIIKMVSGDTYTICLEDYPSLTIEDDNLKIATSSKFYSFELTKLDRYFFAEGSGVKSLDLSSSLFNQTEDRLIVNNKENPVNVSIIADNGVQVYSALICGGENNEISTTGFQPGVYVVSINGVSTKILIK